MTTIIATKDKDRQTWMITLTLAADTKTTGWLESTNNYWDKILQLDDSLIWIAWTSIDKTLVKEIYNEWIKVEWNSLHKMMWVLDFINTLKLNCWMKMDKDENYNINLIIINKTLQVAVRSDWQIISMDERNILAIGSWWVYVYEIYTIWKEGRIKYNYNIQDYFDIVCLLDQYTNNKINSLTIKYGN